MEGYQKICGKERQWERGRIRTPFSVIGCTMLGTLLLSCQLQAETLKTAAILAVIAGVFMLFAGWILRRRVRLTFLVVVCMTGAVALGLAGRERTAFLAAQAFAGKSLTLAGTVSEVTPRSDGGCRFLIRNGILYEDGKEIGRANVLCYGSNELSYHGGEETVLTAELDGELTLTQIALGGQLLCYQPTFVQDTGTRWFYPLLRMRDRLVSRMRVQLYKAMGTEEASWMVGLLTGNREALSEENQALLEGAGLAHLLAVSGLHIALLFSIAGRLLKRLGQRRSTLLALLLTGGYVFLTGGSLSSVRALWMLVFLKTGELLRQPKNTGNALGLAVSVLCLVRPMAVLQPGMLLSAASVWCIYAVLPAIPLNRLPKGTEGLARTGVSGLCISVVTAPVMMLMKGYIPLLGPLCGMLVLPMLPATLALGLAALSGNRWIGLAADGAIHWIQRTARWGNGGVKLPLGGETVQLCCLAVGVLLAVSAFLCGCRSLSLHRTLFLSLTAVLLAVSCSCSVLQSRTEQVTLCCIGDTLLIQKGRQAVAIGCGKSSSAGENLADYLYANGVRELSLLIPEGKKRFTGGSYALLARFSAERILVSETDARLEGACETLAWEGETIWLSGGSVWQLFGTGKMTLRSGTQGVYILLELDGRRILLQDKDDPVILTADLIFYYDDPSYFAEKYGILTEEASISELPGWDAGFLTAEWVVAIG